MSGGEMITARKIETRAAPINVLTGGSGPDLLFLHSTAGIRPARISLGDRCDSGSALGTTSIPIFLPPGV